MGSTQGKYESFILAEEIIKEMLKEGPVPLREIKANFEVLGLRSKDIRLARQSLRVKTTLKNREGYWEIKSTETKQKYRWWRG